jgi:hypothetical protein
MTTGSLDPGIAAIVGVGGMGVFVGIAVGGIGVLDDVGMRVGTIACPELQADKTKLNAKTKVAKMGRFVFNFYTCAFTGAPGGLSSEPHNFRIDL